MSRAILKLALGDALGRTATDGELDALIAALVQRTDGRDRLYIPKSRPVDELAIRQLHGDGLSIRRIAKITGHSKSTIAVVLRQMDMLTVQNSSVVMDKEAA